MKQLKIKGVGTNPSFKRYWAFRSKWEKNNDLRSLNKGETIHALSSFLFFANKGKFDKASILQQMRYF
jgi:TnpA family transposase